MLALCWDCKHLCIFFILLNIFYKIYTHSLAFVDLTLPCVIQFVVYNFKRNRQKLNKNIFNPSTFNVKFWMSATSKSKLNYPSLVFVTANSLKLQKQHIGPKQNKNERKTYSVSQQISPDQQVHPSSVQCVTLTGSIILLNSCFLRLKWNNLRILSGHCCCCFLFFFCFFFKSAFS